METFIIGFNILASIVERIQQQSLVVVYLQENGSPKLGELFNTFHSTRLDDPQTFLEEVLQRFIVMFSDGIKFINYFHSGFIRKHMFQLFLEITFFRRWGFFEQRLVNNFAVTFAPKSKASNLQSLIDFFNKAGLKTGSLANVTIFEYEAIFDGNSIAQFTPTGNNTFLDIGVGSNLALIAHKTVVRDESSLGDCNTIRNYLVEILTYKR